MTNLDPNQEYARDMKGVFYLFALGLFFLGVGIFLAWNHNDLIRHRAAAVGTVVSCVSSAENVPHLHQQGSGIFFTVKSVTYESQCFKYRVDFQTKDNRKASFTIPASYNINIADHVRILYLPDQPEISATINQDYFYAKLWAEIGASIMMISLLIWCLYRFRVL